MFVRLDDGTTVLVRRIRPDDKDLLALAHGRLSSETARRRFLAAKPRLSAGELRYLTEVDDMDHIALVAVLASRPQEIVAVARCVRLPHAPQSAELAIVVADEYQGRGLGTRLGLLLADEAIARGVRRFTASLLADNVVAHRLMRTISMRLAPGRLEGGLDELAFDIAA